MFLKALQTYYLYCLPKAKSKGAEANPYKFGGKELTTDMANAFYDFEAREQLPTLGLFGRPDPKAGDFSWLNTYSYCGADPVNYVDLTGERPTAQEALYLAIHAYQDDDAKNIAESLTKTGWQVSDFATSITMTDAKTGLNSALYERTNSDGKTEYAYVFAGTASKKDVVEDVLQVGGFSKQYHQAIENARQLVKDLGGAELTFVGHSLGGGEAAAASMATGKPAITFNPATVTSLTIAPSLSRSGSSKIVNYITRGVPLWNGSPFYKGGDPLYSAQKLLGLDPPGKRIFIETHSSKWTHGITNFLDKDLPERR